MSTVGARLRIATALTGAGAMDYGCVRRAASRSRRDRVGRAPGARQLCVEKARVQWARIRIRVRIRRRARAAAAD